MRSLPVIFFIGEISTVAMSGFHRSDSLRMLGCSISTVDTAKLDRATFWASRLAKLQGKPGPTLQMEAVNKEILRVAQTISSPDLVWFEWPRLVYLETLEKLREQWPKASFVCFQDDNPFGSRNQQLQWIQFIKNIPFFDIHILKRNTDKQMFAIAGAKKTVQFNGGFYEPIFSADDNLPITKYQSKVSFVGTALDHRVDYIQALLLDHQISVDVFGNRWGRTYVNARKRSQFHEPVYGIDYLSILKNSSISLAFVSSSNGDTFTMRSFEIPAAGTFMLAERTAEHMAFYQEGVEAEFFSSIQECADKIRAYSIDVQLRNRIAAQGMRRCRAHYGLSQNLAMLLKELV